MIRVLVAEDHLLVRDGVRRALEAHGISVVGEAGDGEEAVLATARLLPDVVLLDVSLPRCDGLFAAKAISGDLPNVGIVFLSMFDDEETMAAAAAAGARAYVVKTRTVDELVIAVRAVADGVDLLAEFRSARRPSPTSPLAPLTKRELEVLERAASGLSTREIAHGLYVSYKTAKNHLSAIYDKLGVHGRTEAVLVAMRLGLLRPPSPSLLGDLHRLPLRKTATELRK